MEGNTFIIHTTFLDFKGKRIPWHLSATTPKDDFKSITIGLSLNDLEFDYNDIKSNHDRNLDQFPRSKSLELTCEYNMKKKDTIIYLLIDHLNLNENSKLFAIDTETYHFLLGLSTYFSVSLIQSQINDRTLAHAYRYSKDKKYLHAIEIVFILYKNEMVPWHICITSTKSPNHYSMIIGLSTKELIFSTKEWEFNETMVKHFPRPDSLNLDYEFDFIDFKEKLLDEVFMKKLHDNQWYAGTVIVFDEPTYNYLAGFVNNLHLTFIRSKYCISEDRTLAAAYRLHQDTERPTVKIEV